MKTARAVTVTRRKRAGVEGALTVAAFLVWCDIEGFPVTPEYRFAPPRKWRFDYAWPDRHVALEVDGGIWTKGRHTRGAGWLKDTVKLNTAAALGWRLLRCTPDTLTAPATLDLIRAALTLTPLPAGSLSLTDET